MVTHPPKPGGYDLKCKKEEVATALYAICSFPDNRRRAVGVALLFAAPAIGFAWWRRRKPLEQFFDVPAEEDPEVHLGQLKRFSLRELQVATDGSLVAVKRLKEETHSGLKMSPLYPFKKVHGKDA